MRQQQQARRAAHEYDFLPAHLEVLEKPAAPWARRTALALMALLIISLIWSVVGEIDIHASAQGKVLISSHSKVIQSSEQGEVKAIYVRDGQHVQQGDLLIQLNPTGADAEVTLLEEKRAHLRLEQARISALLHSDPLEHFTVPEAAVQEQADRTLAHLKSEYFALKAELNRIAQLKTTAQAELHENQVETRALRLLTQNTEARLDAHRQLAASQVIAQQAYLEKEKELLSQRKLLDSNLAKERVVRTRIQSYQKQREELISKKQLEWHQGLSEVRVKLQQAEQELIKAKERLRLQSLRSPVSGIVQELNVHTLGGVVQSAQALMVIVPEVAQLEAEVNILNKDIGFIVPGQSVEVKIHSFPFTKYGTISGKVLHVSRDAVEDDKQGLVFPARVELLEDRILVDDHWVSLNAGMSLQAEIKTGRRRIIEYILSPLQQYQAEAIRER